MKTTTVSSTPTVTEARSRCSRSQVVMMRRTGLVSLSVLTDSTRNEVKLPENVCAAPHLMHKHTHARTHAASVSLRTSLRRHSAKVEQCLETAQLLLLLRRLLLLCSKISSFP